MVINPILFFDDEIQDYISIIGKKIPFFSKYYMILLYDESEKSKYVREVLNSYSEINTMSGSYYVLTYMPNLPDYVKNNQTIGSEQIKSEFVNYDFEQVYSKMRWIATRFGVQNDLPLIIVASREEKGCIPIKLLNLESWSDVSSIIGQLTYILNNNYSEINDLNDLRKIIDKNGITCEYKKIEDDVISSISKLRNRIKPTDEFNNLYKKYRIGRGNKNLRTEKDIALELGVTQKSYGDWKNDRVTPSFETVVKIGKCISADINDTNKLLDSYGYRELNMSYIEDQELWNDSKSIKD